ncbi:MAG: hypothetical protein LBC74_08015 [Planctomycetaceae bacterium]|nr:hypothetical protein [Planctomycetaceae bacterium]
MDKPQIKIFDIVFNVVDVFRFMSIVAVMFCAVSCRNLLINPIGSLTDDNNFRTKTPLLRDGDVPIDTAAIEIFNIRITPTTETYLYELWQETDEQVIPALVRLNLYRNGIRAGIQGSLISSALSHLINISSNPEKPQYINGMREISVAEVSRELPVSRQFQNLFPDTRIVLKPFDTALYELSLFESDGNQIWGKTYTNAQGQFGLTAKPVNDGKVRFEVIPELEYGLPETRMYSRQGIMFTETSKPRRVYDTLKFSVDLLPGNWLILGPTSASNCVGTGRCFFVRGNEQFEQRIIAIRLINLKRPATNNEIPKNNNQLPERR